MIHSGTMIYIGIRTVNTLETYWGHDALDFRPDRWLRMDEKQHTTVFDVTKPMGPDNSAAFQSFLFGSHACMGRDIAMSELRIILACVPLLCPDIALSWLAG